ncbi:phosphatidylinositol transfer protein PDR16 isoform X3 [Canna indica]|uniref:Phosphatidylinositol transfer protein PDR16 isoform X3 n=1 Tax=Canna indica TaxID=4628 RepID=A0AAQ3JVD1_9LILI|nr:phosphatidylinositol transfer protein PDR16 isoform X3 [Canna indica]
MHIATPEIVIGVDPKTCQKVKFVYPKNEESTSLMHKNFDLEVLPEKFGGKSKVQYNHEEFSKLMRKDDIKTAAVWGLDDKTTLPSHTTFGNSTSEVAPAPGHFTAQAR